MSRGRKGKIARLPEDIRNDVNSRLRNGQAGPILLKWLNELPVVKTVLEQNFEGKPVTAQNLSEWRRGGYTNAYSEMCSEAAPEIHERLHRLNAEIELFCSAVKSVRVGLESVRLLFEELQLVYRAEKGLIRKRHERHARKIKELDEVRSILKSKLMHENKRNDRH